MTRLAAWVLICFVVAVVAYRRAPAVLGAGLVIWMLVPYVASFHLTGVSTGSLSIGAGSWLIVATFVVQLIRDPYLFLNTLTARFPFFAAILLFITAAAVETKTGSSGHGLVKVFDQMTVPLLGFWTLSALALRDPTAVPLVRRVVIALGVFEAAYAVTQFALGRVILWGHAYTKEYWYTPGYHRWMGTTDSPLVLSLIACATIPLLKSLRRVWLQNVFAAMLIGAVVVSQARTGVIVGALATLYIIVRTDTSLLRRVVSMTAVAIAGILIAGSSLVTGLNGRLANDTGSAAARNDAYSYFGTHWTHFLFAGHGIDYSFTLAPQLGLITSFESAFIMYSIDVGVLLTTVYFGAMLILVLMNSRLDTSGAWVSALVVLVLVQTFSSLEDNSVVGPLMFVLLGLAANSPGAGDTVRRRLARAKVPAPDDVWLLDPAGSASAAAY